METARRQTPSHRSRYVIALALGLALAVGAPLGWWATHRPGGASTSSFGNGAAQQLAGRPAPTAAATSIGAPTPTPGSSAAPPSVAGRPSTKPPAPLAIPARLQIPSVGVVAPVVAVGVNAVGEMDIPEAVGQVGWYRWSSAPGGPTGSMVIAGHVDSATQGLGALFRLREVAAGASISIRSTDGRTWNYRVVGREEFPKTRVPLSAIFARTGSPRLTIVTCGGAFDRARRSYEDNIVVTAVAA